MKQNKIILSIPKKQFSKDFLDIEVKKKLGVRGDTLTQHFRGEMQRIHSRNKRSNIFNSAMFYMVTEKGNNVILTGSKV